MWNPFKSKTNYLPQQIPAKPLELLEALDAVMLSQSEVNEHQLMLHELQIPILDQFKSIDKLKSMINLPQGYYLPRSIAFYIDAAGTWVFVIGVRQPGTPNPTANNMFIELLTRTNGARNA